MSTAALQQAGLPAIPRVMTKRIEADGAVPVGSTPQQYADLIKSEVVRWHKLIREQKISLD